MGLLDRDKPPVPVTVIGGFLGAGKTTLVNHVLRKSGGKKIAVLVNDFGEVNIDGALIVGVEGDVITMSNGCICCTIKNDVVGALFRILERKDRIEHVLIETSGVSNPSAVVETFLELQQNGALRLDGVVVVVDAEHFLELAPEHASLAKWQVRAADVLLLNKVDLVSEEKSNAVEAEIRRHAPEARIVRAVEGEVPVAALLALERDPIGEGEDHDHAHDHGAHGFESWRFTTSRPIRFKALKEVLKALPAQVFRVKGFLNIEERKGDRLVLHVVGKRIFVRTIDAWGEREPKTDLILIGRPEGMHWQKVERELAACEVCALSTPSF